MNREQREGILNTWLQDLCDLLVLGFRMEPMQCVLYDEPAVARAFAGTQLPSVVADAMSDAKPRRHAMIWHLEESTDGKSFTPIEQFNSLVFANAARAHLLEAAEVHHLPIGDLRITGFPHGPGVAA